MRRLYEEFAYICVTVRDSLSVFFCFHLLSGTAKVHNENVSFSACYLSHQPNVFSCDSPIFHSGLRKEGSQGRGVPAIPSLNQPSFEGEIDQEENQEPCPKRLVHTEEWVYGGVQSRFTPLKE